MQFSLLALQTSEDTGDREDNYATFYNNPSFSDIVLKAQRTKILAHKVVLAAHSPSLEAMLQVRRQLAECFLPWGIRAIQNVDCSQACKKGQQMKLPCKI